MSPTELLAELSEVHCYGSEAATDHMRAAEGFAQAGDWYSCGSALRRAEDYGCPVADLVDAALDLECSTEQR